MAWSATAVALTVVGLALALGVVALGLILWCLRRQQASHGPYEYCSPPEGLLAQALLAPEEHLARRLQSPWSNGDEHLHLFLPEYRRALVGAATVTRCHLTESFPGSEKQTRQLRRLLAFAQLVLQADDTFFSGSKDLSTTEDCFVGLVRLQTDIATAISANRSLDTITGNERGESGEGWFQDLQQEVSRQLDRLSKLLEIAESLGGDAVWGLADDRQRLQAAVMLSFELQEPDYGVVDEFPAVPQVISRALSRVMESRDMLVPVSHPTWFDPCLLLWKSRSTSAREVWQIGLTDVGCSFLRDNSSASEEECIRRANLWSRLLHPNVVALEAASYVGTPFFVYEVGVPLAEVVETDSGSDFKWTRLYEAALGLQYLQSRSAVFQALTPASILVVEVSSGSGGELKHPETGGGVCKVNCDRVAQPWWPNQLDRLGDFDWEWLAPERLEGEPASLEADVFSFGKCILHVVMSGEQTDDHQADLSSLEEPERDLISRMCAQEPHDRVSISYVVAQLQRFAEMETRRHNAASSSTMVKMEEKPTETSLKDIRLRDGIPVSAALSTARRSIERSDKSDGGDLVAMQSSVLMRVEQLIASLSTHSNGSIATDTAETLADVVSRLVVLSNQTSAASASVSWLSASYAASTAIRRQVSDVCRSLHQQLDRVLSSLDAVHQQDAVHSSWRVMWDAKPTAESLVLQIDPTNERQSGMEEQLVVLQFEIQHRAGSYASETLASMRREIDRLEQLLGPRPLPIWFLPAYEVEFDALDAFAQGAFGSVHRGRWLDSSVVVKKVFASGDAEEKEDDADDLAVFVREADIWSALKHDNIVQLYGACHLRGWRFFVGEFAPFGTLDAYLRAQRTRSRADQTNRSAVNVWRLLYGVGCGLKLLHQRGIAHGDLKCNNVLIGRDETPKLTDFGLSEAGKGSRFSTDSGDGDDADGKPAVGAVGAYRWKAPEVLRGEVGTSCDADVFSFGMVIIEAVTGDVPWGRDLPDAAVKFHAMKGQLPLRPRRMLRGGVGVEDDKVQGDEFADDEWELVLAMCRFDPSTRLPLREAVSRILQFSLRR